MALVPLVVLEKWTRVTNDPALVEHLFKLYFEFVNPVHFLLEEVNFRKDFKEGSETYCTAGLDNIICALSCYLIEDESMYVASEEQRAELQKKFKAVAKPHLQISVTTETPAQEYAVLYLVEVYSGDARNGFSYLTIAQSFFDTKLLENGTRLPEHPPALGAYSLAAAYATIFNQMPCNMSYFKSFGSGLNNEDSDLGRPDSKDFIARIQAYLGRAIHFVAILQRELNHEIMTASQWSLATSGSLATTKSSSRQG